jgi:uroporphyrinogen decarboxylase
VFDTWGGVLGPAMYREFSLPYLVRIARELKRPGQGAHPVILFGKGNAPHLEDLFASGADASAWTGRSRWKTRHAAPMAASPCRATSTPRCCTAMPDAIRAQVRGALDSYAIGNGGSREGHVFNLGHGMSPDMNPDHAVHALSWPYHE